MTYDYGPAHSNEIMRMMPTDDHQIGMEDGDTCARFHEPDEDAPRGYKPKPCPGVMMLENDELTASCPICGETA